MHTLGATEAQLVDRAPQGQDMLHIKRGADSGWLILAQECPHALVIMLRRIDLVENGTIPFPQRFQPHLRYDIGRAVRVVAGEVIDQPAFPFHSLVEAGPKWGLK